MIFVQVVWEEIEKEFLLEDFEYSSVFTIQKDNATLSEVYKRRARRILSPMIVLITKS